MRSASTVYILQKILIAPQLVLFTLLVFIAYKDLEATPLQVALLAAARPLSSVISFYVAALTAGSSKRIRLSMAALSLATSLPSLIFPFYHQIYFLIGAYISFLVTSKAVTPPLIQTVKIGCEQSKRGSILAWGNSIYYVANMVLPLTFSYFLDRDYTVWPYLFFATALLQLPMVYFISQVGLPNQIEARPVRPLRDGLQLLYKKPQFLHFHAMLFIGGMGLLLIKPVLPLYFKDVLDISYKELALAFSFCKGLSYVASAQIWAHLSTRFSLFTLSAWVKMIAALYPISLMLSQLYPAFIFYGAMRGGSELCWSLSGPYFSEKEDSTLYSSLNIVIGGLRGITFSFLGLAAYFYLGSEALFAIAVVPAIVGAIYALFLNKRYTQVAYA